MKIDKEKLNDKMSKLKEGTIKLAKTTGEKTKELANKTKETAITTTNKIKSIEKKEIMSEDDIMKLLDVVYGNVLNGLGDASPAIDKFTQDYLSKEPNPEKAAKNMINNQILKCTTSGFITGFGGLITLPITLPANITSVIYVQMRMIVSTAIMAGYDPKTDEVQTLVYACLAGVSVNEILKQAGIKFGTKLATSMIKKIPGKTLTKINQKVGFRFITKFGSKGIINLGKAVPVVGAVIGGGMDFVETKIIGARAYKWFFEGNMDVDKKEEEQIIEEIEEVQELEFVEKSQ